MMLHLQTYWLTLSVLFIISQFDQGERRSYKLQMHAKRKKQQATGILPSNNSKIRSKSAKKASSSTRLFTIGDENLVGNRLDIAFQGYYMDEKWKISKKEGSGNYHCSSSTSSKLSLSRSFSAKSSISSSSKSPLLRSSSQKNPCFSSSSSSSSKCPLPRSCSQKSSSISTKCSSLAKEQKARFYIMRRCVAMLVCWHEHGDS